MTRLVLVTSNPCETAAGALYDALFYGAQVLVMSITNIREMDQREICTLPSETTSILMIGTYWVEKLLTMFMKILPTVKITVLCACDAPETQYPNVSFVSDPRPCNYILNLALEELESKTCALLTRRMFQSAIDKIDDVFNFRNVEANQAFFTGMMNFEVKHDEKTLFDRFHGFFCGDYDEPEIIANGQAILNSQLTIVKERVLNNSKQIQLQDGTKAVITEASELVNLTHEALHRQYPDASVTLVVGLKLGNKDELAYSIRSFDASVNAQTLAKKIGGDGTATTAGGRVAIDLPYPL